MIAPQDQVSSDTPHKEAPSDQINALDLATVDAAREDANRAASAMRVIGAPVQSAISAINNADNPIPLVDSISNFLKTLSSFNSVVDKIAPVRSAVPTRSIRSTHAGSPICASRMDRPFLCSQGPPVTQFPMMQSDLCLPDYY